MQPNSGQQATLPITLHIGPHKTGTTAIQQWLLDNRAALLEQGIHYPPPERNGPGHAVIAWELRGQHGLAKSQARFKRAIAEAAEAGATRLLLSSENFCHGLYDGVLERLPGKQEIEVVVTLNELRSRFVSMVYEAVKHRAHFDFSNFDTIGFINSKSSLRPELISRLLTAFPDNRITVILTSKSTPLETYCKFNACLGTALPMAGDKLVNERSDPAFIETMNFFNARLPEASHEQIWVLVTNIQNFLAHHKVQGHFNGLVPSNDVVDMLDAMWRAQMSHLESLSALGRIRLL